MNQKYEAIIGLEVHAQLNTLSKAYSSDANEYGKEVNTLVSAITLGLPGTLPVINQKCIDHAITLGLALNCKIRHENQFARKNYYYADLPKGYQITQDKTPICTEGHIEFEVQNENETYTKRIGITRIHMEEDAGKSIHDIDPYYSLIDLNRAGVPLLEIVSEPDFRTAQEAYQYLTEMRQLLRYLEVCDGNMEEGSMRCDVNVSVKLRSSEQWGTKVEIKNLNSMRNVKRALDYEIARQIETIEKGETIKQETRQFDALKGTTHAMRSKEAANDYRYFPEPDLPPIFIDEKYINEVKQKMNVLPKEYYQKFTTTYKLNSYDANLLIENKEIAQYFEECIKENINPKTASNWINGVIKNYLNEKAIGIKQFPITPLRLKQICNLVEEKAISLTMAQSNLFEVMLVNTNEDPITICKQNQWLQENNLDVLENYVNEVLNQMPDKVAQYKSGKKGLIGLFVGEVMKLSKGKADPKSVNDLLEKKLN